MPVTRRLLLVGAVGLCLLIVWLWRPAPNRPGALSIEPALRSVLPPPSSPFEVALREAWVWQTRAGDAANRDLEAWKESDLAGADRASARAWRRGAIAHDRGGYLRRARARARQAEALAHTPSEVCRAVELLVVLECDAGHHAAELRQARRLVALQHGSWRSLCVLHRAATCNGDIALMRQASAAIAAIEAKQATSAPPWAFHGAPPLAPASQRATNLPRP